MAQNVDFNLQQRVRRLLGLTGGPAIGVVEAVQPVSIISGWTEQRQPQLESGDMLVRTFVAEMSLAAVALKFAAIGIRVGAGTRALIWVRKVLICEPTAAAVFQVTNGRIATTLSHASNGTASYTDTRFPFNNLLEAPVSIGGLTDAGPFGTQQGFRWVNGRAAETVVLDVDHVLTDLGAGSGELVVINGTLNQGLRVSFEGIVFQEQQ